MTDPADIPTRQRRHDNGNLRCLGYVGAQWSLHSVVKLAATVLLLFMPLLATVDRAFAQPADVLCTGGKVQPNQISVGGAGDPIQPNLVVSGPCTVEPGKYYFRFVNVISGGTLNFVETKPGFTKDNDVDFWATSIIIENKGTLSAGTSVPFGRNGGTLTIALYGRDQSNGNPVTLPGQGALCVTPAGIPVKRPDGADDVTGPCGIPSTIWGATDDSKITLPGSVSDYFYQYDPLYGDGLEGPKGPGYFGYKVLGLSFGGSLILRGEKGTTGAAAADADPMQSGTSWVRLAQGSSLSPNAPSMVVNRGVEHDWQENDQVVVTSTDYLPNHSEILTIGPPNGTTVPLKAYTPINASDPREATALPKWPHNGVRYNIAAKLGLFARITPAGSEAPPVFTGPAARLSLNPELLSRGAETRAAVALLTRSIRIVSGGNAVGQPLAPPPSDNQPANPDSYFGGHTVFRQGFEKLQIQGVEFAKLGQGGRLGHYPVHFHMARQTPVGTFVKDSSVNESMTRWFVIHSTLGVTLVRNVGYKSIGHGYYLEDGTETDNKFYSNIGITVRAAVYGGGNDRRVPGILALNDIQGDVFPFISDVNHPTTFWIMNGWNDFVGNFSVGAGTCGACYWLVPGVNSEMSHSHGGHAGKPMKWSGYSALQAAIKRDAAGNPVLDAKTNQTIYLGMAGTTPLRLFYGNSCSSAMSSFITVGDTAACNGVVAAPPKGLEPPGTPLPGNQIKAIRSIAPARATNFWDNTYYPRVDPGVRFPTICDPNAAEGADLNCGRMASVSRKCANGDPKDCATTVLDRFTTSFNWPDYNFAAMWLRSGWYLVQDSVLSDMQNAGLTFVSGGDYTRSSVPVGYWAVMRQSVLIGETQPNNPFADAAGPFNTQSKRNGVICIKDGASTCVSPRDGLAMQLSNFGVSQRMFSIYDGPTYQEANAYIDIKESPCTNDDCMYWATPGVRLRNGSQGYLPHAAIGWKQPNGFYYPPAFHSTNLFFTNVAIRHYLVEPILQPRTYLTDTATARTRFTGTVPSDMFTGYTDIDRQTELNDDDGSLTGFRDTISVNQDNYFNAPVETAQCLSNLGVTPSNACGGTTPTRATAKTSPYDYVTTVVYPGCALDGGNGACGNVDPVPPNSCNVDGTRCTAKQNRGGLWSRDCAGPYCVGIPLYRQFLTGSAAAGTETREWAEWIALGCNTNPASSNPWDVANPNASKCLFPFARMAGTSTWQRSAMTVNGGTYYIDTTVSETAQRVSQFAGKATDPNSVFVDCSLKQSGGCSPLSVNVFQPNQKYYVFFIYAKGTTKQIYQMYVGTNFDVNSVKLARMEVNGAPFRLATPVESLPSSWKAEMVVGADGQRDVLQVTVDMTVFSNILNPRAAVNITPPQGPGGRPNSTCQPASFCTATGNSCGCSLASNDPRVLINPGLKAACQQVCSTWAVKDLDCPEGGCLGFEVTLPGSGSGGFQANNQYKRPKPTTFPITDSWVTQFQRTSTQPDGPGEPAGDCSYPKIPGTAQCPINDNALFRRIGPALGTPR